MKSQLIYLILIFLVTCVMGHLLGTNILNLIDHRMNDISINMPKINLPKPTVIVNLDKKNSLYGGGTNTNTYYQLEPEPQNQNIKISPTIKKLSEKQEIQTNHEISKIKFPTIKKINEPEETSTNSDSTYYKDPTDLNPRQIIKFKYRARLSKMTFQDYRNWLSVFQNDTESLYQKFPEHLPNYEKYIEEKLTIGDFNDIKRDDLASY